MKNLHVGFYPAIDMKDKNVFYEIFRVYEIIKQKKKGQYSGNVRTKNNRTPRISLRDDKLLKCDVVLRNHL